MENEADFNITGDEELIKSLNAMQHVTSSRLVIAALRKAGNAINRQAKTNFMSSKKNKSKTNYSGFNSLFKVERMRSKEKVGVKVGLTGYSAYKYRWLNWGTEERSYKKNGTEHRTGKIQPNKFFTDAVSAKMEESHKMVSDALIKSIKKLANQ